ncbi:archease [Microtetraspora malaysiensis]|uniref:archease n=1 Tax=Microtetraspora malaysiensis TaxID=161358 RepID=UPI003D8A21B8
MERHPEPGAGPPPAQGHTTLPHTADVRIKAWAPTRAECVAEAVRAMVEGFADLSDAVRCGTRSFQVEAGPPEDQILAVLDEVIYEMDVGARVPCSVDVREDEDGLHLTLGMTDVATVPQIGAVPKGISLHDLRFDRAPEGWMCTVTVDV